MPETSTMAKPTYPERKRSGGAFDQDEMCAQAGLDAVKELYVQTRRQLKALSVLEGWSDAPRIENYLVGGQFLVGERAGRFSERRPAGSPTGRGVKPLLLTSPLEHSHHTLKHVFGYSLTEHACQNRKGHGRPAPCATADSQNGIDSDFWSTPSRQALANPAPLPDLLNHQ
jgi:hypothetical protein